MPYPELEKILTSRFLLEEEKKMWLRIGIYVATEEHDIITSTGGRRTVMTLFDGAGNKMDIQANCARNIRQSVLAWWQVERVSPRAKEKEVDTDLTGLAGLESRNG